MSQSSTIDVIIAFTYYHPPTLTHWILILIIFIYPWTSDEYLNRGCYAPFPDSIAVTAITISVALPIVLALPIIVAMSSWVWQCKSLFDSVYIFVAMPMDYVAMVSLCVYAYIYVAVLILYVTMSVFVCLWLYPCDNAYLNVAMPIST